jgi:protein TonB
MDFLYERRQSVAGLATATILGVLIVASNWHVELIADTTPTELTLETMPEPVPPAPAAPPAPSEVVPPPIKTKEPSFEKPKPPQPQKPRPPTPVRVSKPSPAAAPSPVQAAAPARPAAPSNPSADIQNRYAAALRAYLQSIRRYPNTKEARMLHPQGTAELWFVLDRSGALVEAGIEQGAGSPILDRAALATVRGGTYPPFPDDAFPGEGTRRFTVKLDYQLN